MKITKNIEQYLSLLIIFGIISFVGNESFFHHHNYKTISTQKVIDSDYYKITDDACLICDLLKNFQKYYSTQEEYRLTYTTNNSFINLKLNSFIANRLTAILGRAPPAINHI